MLPEWFGHDDLSCLLCCCKSDAVRQPLVVCNYQQSQAFYPSAFSQDQSVPSVQLVSAKNAKRAQIAATCTCVASSGPVCQAAIRSLDVHSQAQMCYVLET